MKKSYFIIALVAVVMFSGVSSLKAEVAWMDNFSAAQKVAEKSQKPILLFFTGSDWCIWCKRLDQEVFDKPVFAKWVKANMVPVIIDFPRDRSKHTAEGLSLQKKYAITGYPTLILLSPKGKVIGKTGYVAGGPENYIKNLKNLLR